MKFIVAIECDSDAFGGRETVEDGPVAEGTEISRILMRLASFVDGEDILIGWRTTLSDINGKRVGRAVMTDG